MCTNDYSTILLRYRQLVTASDVTSSYRLILRHVGSRDELYDRISMSLTETDFTHTLVLRCIALRRRLHPHPRTTSHRTASQGKQSSRIAKETLPAGTLAPRDARPTIVD